MVTQVVRGISWIETGADINQLAPARVMPQIDIPILIIHGDADRIVPVDHASKLHAAARNATIHIEPDSPHIGTVMLNSHKYERLVSQHFLRASPPDSALD
jgi:pimeloyl-ACP methyl ester carboxylesterase